LELDSYGCEIFYHSRRINFQLTKDVEVSGIGRISRHSVVKETGRDQNPSEQDGEKMYITLAEIEPWIMFRIQLTTK